VTGKEMDPDHQPSRDPGFRWGDGLFRFGDLLVAPAKFPVQSGSIIQTGAPR